MHAQAELLPSEWPDPPQAPTSVRVVVYGTPAPQGSKKFVGFAKPKPGEQRGRAILVESSKEVGPWRDRVMRAALDVRDGAPPIDAPVRVRMVFTMQKPASAPKRRRSYPATRPDVSKLARSTEDAIVESGLLSDDARIVEYTRLAKVYPGEDPDALEAPGVLIVIEAIE
jgi:Holliday junction resolvase RusA-like endonuclease